MGGRALGRLVARPHGFFQGMDGFGSSLAFLGQLHADAEVVATGPDWESANGPLLSADLMAGQTRTTGRAPAPGRASPSLTAISRR